MLRSLVGSEMCIRDRLRRDGHRGGAAMTDEILRVENLTVGYNGSHALEDCLLYTSDAADDLLCVDLGGRRIIKKKHQSYPVNHHDHPILLYPS